MRIKLILIGLIVFVLSIPVLSQNAVVQILSHKEDSFVNIDCKKNKTCDLKKVEYFVEDYSVGIGDDYNYGTRFFARYETESVKNLQKYVFVPFLRGCLFSSKMVNGKIDTYQDVTYPRVDSPVLFKFPNWTIDSYNFDPVYSAMAGGSRFDYYLWNTIPGSLDKDTEKVYGHQKPTTPQLYIVDHPGSAFYSNDVAHNISLELKTCIYKTKDVPMSVSHDNIDFAKPIHCYGWNSSFVYNHSTKEFQSYYKIVTACR